jgi:hypothetical protein
MEFSATITTTAADPTMECMFCKKLVSTDFAAFSEHIKTDPGCNPPKTFDCPTCGIKICPWDEEHVRVCSLKRTKVRCFFCETTVWGDFERFCDHILFERCIPKSCSLGCPEKIWFTKTPKVAMSMVEKKLVIVKLDVSRTNYRVAVAMENPTAVTMTLTVLGFPPVTVPVSAGFGNIMFAAQYPVKWGTTFTLK